MRLSEIYKPATLIFSAIDRRLKLWIIVAAIIRVFSVALDLLGLLCVGVVTSLIANTTISSGSIVGGLIDNLGKLGIPNPTYFFAGLAVGVYILKAGIGALDNFRVLRHLAKEESQAAEITLLDLLTSPLEKHEKWNRQQLIQGLTSSFNHLYSQSIGAILSIVAEAAVILTVSISLFLVSPILFVAMGTLLCSVSFATQRLILRRASEEAKISMNHTLNSQRLADEGFRNFRQISTGGNSKGFSFQFFTQRWLGALHNAKYTSLQSLPRYIVEIAVISSVALIGLMQMMFGFEVVPALSIGMFLAGLFRLMSALVPLQGSLGVLARSIPESELARDFLFAAIENRKEDALAEISSAQVENPVIKFSNVSFSYPLAEVETLTDVNFEISFGQLIFLSGKSGAGKSTLVDLLLGLRHPTKGCVTIGGVGASSFPSKAYVPQATALIAGTLAQNISFDFGESMSSERWSKVESVVELLGLTNLVERTPEGLNGLVGEGGISLSGGETQRVGIARSLIDNPKIIVFDEVTSALDSETAEVFRAIINRLRGNVTILVITHGETSGYDFDGELKILDGCVTQIGRMKHT